MILADLSSRCKDGWPMTLPFKYAADYTVGYERISPDIENKAVAGNDAKGNGRARRPF
ncbi:hypothetical protein [Rhodanobacter sp. BL-MT-08]